MRVIEEAKKTLINKPVRVYLSNKVMLEGKLTNIDEVGVVLDGKTFAFLSNVISVVPDEEKKE